MIAMPSAAAQTIREYLDEIPVINTHEHNTGITGPVTDALSFIVDGYFNHDLMSAAFGEREALGAALWDTALPFDDRYALFAKFYEKSRHTSYCRSMLKGLEACWGITEISKASVLELQDKMSGRDQAFRTHLIRKHRIVTQIPDIRFDRFIRFVEGQDNAYTENCRFAFPLPEFHRITQRAHLHLVQRPWMKGKITTLDEYVEAFARILRRAADFGVVCLKDQSAYWRALDYRNPTKAEAEAVFNRLIYDGNDAVSPADSLALDDWLFQLFMRLAREINLPVQLHTGHLAGNGGDVRKANAAHLIPLLELHSDVRFDLFHANWPYMDEILFICKNYPNAHLNFCWAHIIDPVYCIEMMKRAVMTVPHTKIFAFGGDTWDIEHTIGHLLVAKDNVAMALGELVDRGWLTGREARDIALDWFFNNPNEAYRLNSRPVSDCGTV